MTDLFQELSEAIQSYDPEIASKVAKKAVESEVDPTDAIDKGLAKGLRAVGDKFEKGEVFMTHLAMAAEAMKAAMQVLEPELRKRKAKMKSLATMVIGTVEGDIHDIGKNLVATMMSASGFNVIDLGTDVPAQRFVDEVKKHGAKIVGASALLTTTRLKQKETVEMLKATGLRENTKLIVGGAAVNEEWAKEVGADAYGPNAVEAVRLVKSLLNIKE